MDEPTAKRYWKSLEERDGDVAFQQRAGDEFPPAQPGTPLARRDFLKAAGFTVALAATGCSRAPVQKAIPLLVQPEEIVPGRSLLYASTCAGCAAGCGVLAKARDGRPIKLEGNPQHALSRGGLCAVGQASILGLYDSQRLQQPLLRGKKAEWAEVDGEVAAQLEPLRSQAGVVRFLTGTITSPTLRAAIAEFLRPFPEARHVQYDPLSRSAILDAHERTHGARLLPRYRFERAEVIASFDADFLGTWISPVEFTADYRAGRDLEATPPRMSYHVQLEPRMSITGSKADRRYAIAPAEMAAVISALASRIAGLAKASFEGSPQPLSLPPAALDDLASRLWNARGRSLVISGSNDAGEQALINYINHLLGNYGSTLDVERPSYQAQGSDRELSGLISEMRDGRVKALFVYGVNPAFDLPGVDKLLTGVPLLVSLAERRDETAALAQMVAPDHHYLESWSDAEPVSGAISVTQPAVRPLFGTRPALESLARWSGRSGSAYELLRAAWSASIYPRRLREASFDAFWDTAVHDGYVEVKPEPVGVSPFNLSAVTTALPGSAIPAAGFALVLYPKAGMLDGRHAYNPWLQELPDPISKVTWDNYACLSPAAAQRLQVGEGDVIRIEAPDRGALDLPVYVQPGQQDSVVAVALGYGSALSGRFATIGPQWLDSVFSTGDNGLVGTNAAPWLQISDGHIRYWQPAVQLSKTGKHRDLASTQTHNTLTVPQRLAPPDGRSRPIVQETALTAFLKDPHSGVYDPEEKEDLWPEDHPYSNLRWGMVVDLAACTGCSACVIACQAENNVPVVGKDEVRRNRAMHWVRIDRYYSEPEPGQVEVSHQPMMCQQCENAPCETVCPVLATVHSAEGLNSQVYNRCVGTRYCANNCPYKARRFNWFDYARNDLLQNLALSPDVTVRMRGVMEKCTFCVQRLQEAKIEAKRRGLRVEDGAVQTACQQSCPARAISFGDLNDGNSQVSRMMKNPRRYRVLSELNVKPSIGYLTVVRNRSQNDEEERHG